MLRHVSYFFKKNIAILLFIIVSTFGVIGIASANDYKNFKELFTVESGATNIIYNLTALKDTGVSFEDTSFRLVANFRPTTGQTSITEAEAEKAWSYVADDFDEGFALRFCIREGTTENCYYSPIPYLTNYTAAAAQKYFITRDRQNDFTNGGIIIYSPKTQTTITANPIPGAPGTTQTISGVRSVYKEQNSEVIKDLIIPYGSTTTAELWYCAGKESGEDGTVAPPDNVLIRQFKGLCGDTAYFKVGEAKAMLTLKETKELATGGVIDPTTLGPTGATTAARNSALPSCSMSDGTFSNGTLIGCLAQLFYYVVFRPIAWFTSIMGTIFDFFVGFSINDEAYRLSFIDNTWRIIRDISNIFFILIMVYTGFSVVLGFGKYSLKAVVGTLIVNALLINFSLFFTRLAIDFSNILGRLFYNRINVTTTEDTVGGYKSISTAIISSFNPQKLLQSDILSKDAQQKATDNTEQDVNFNVNNQSLTSKITNPDTSEYAAFFIVVTLSSAIILFFVAKMFWGVGFIFVGRIVSLYINMIFSPVAILTQGGVPLLGSLPKLNFGQWSSDLKKSVILAPIFMFFLYIIGAFLNAGFVSTLGIETGNGAETYFTIVISVVIPMIIVYTLISYGKTLAEKFATEVSNKVTGFVEGAGKLAAGAALGVATGGLAVAGRNIIGRAGAKIASSQRLRNTMKDGGVLGKLANRTLKTGETLSKASYDARNTKSFNKYMGDFGTPNSKLGGFLGTNQKNTEGGFRGAIDRKIKKENDYADRMLMTGQEAKAQDASRQAWEQAYQGRRTTAENSARAQNQVFDEKAFRAGEVAANPPPQTASEININRETANNARLARGSFITRNLARIQNRTTVPTGALGVAGTAISAGLGATAIAGATVVGQSAITRAAQQQVAQSRTANTKPQMSTTQTQKLQDKINQLQQELNRRITTLNQIASTVGRMRNPPTNLSFSDLTPADIIDYQNNMQDEIDTIQSTIDGAQNFIDNNKNNPNRQIQNQINIARATIRSEQNNQNQVRAKKQQANTIFAEFNRIENDIKNVRQQLGQ